MILQAGLSVGVRASLGGGRVAGTEREKNGRQQVLRLRLRMTARNARAKANAGVSPPRALRFGRDDDAVVGEMEIPSPLVILRAERQLKSKRGDSLSTAGEVKSFGPALWRAL